MSQRQIRKFIETTTIIAALSLSLTGYSAAASFDMFLKIDGIKGEATDKSHKDEVAILAWSWGASNSGNARVGGGGGSGKPNVQDISVTKFVDKSSPALLGKVCQGDHIKEVVLTVRKAGGKEIVEFYKLTLNDVLVSSISTGSSNGQELMTENVSFNFAKFKIEYTPMKADGTGAASVPYAYNIKENKPN